MANEIEVKLAAEPAKLKLLNEMTFDGVMSSSEWVGQSLKNTYFDTQNFKLRELKIGLRIRAQGEQLIQTVKSSGKSMGGLHQRNESEAFIDEFKIDIDQVEDPYLKILLEEAIEEDGELQPVFSTHFQRQTSDFNFEDGTVIEVAIDQGNIYYDDESSPISEVELELKQGNARHLFQLSRQLISQHDFVVSNSSKAGRGYSLCSEIKVTDRRITTLEISPGTAAEEAFEMICYNGLKHWQYYEQFLESSIAPEAILQMYRALLYVQNVYHIFGALIPRHATTDLRANWEWLSQFLESIVSVANQRKHLNMMLNQGLASEEQLAEAFESSEVELKTVVEKFKKLLSSSRYNLVMLGISEWLFFKDWRPFIEDKNKVLLNAPIIDFAVAQLEHILREFKRSFDSKDPLSEVFCLEQVSKLRRALDMGLFFGGLFDHKQRQQYRQPWLDLLAGTREIEFNRFATDCMAKYEIKNEKDLAIWSDKRKSSVLEAMEQTRKAMFKSKPYWSR